MKQLLQHPNKQLLRKQQKKNSNQKSSGCKNNINNNDIINNCSYNYSKKNIKNINNKISEKDINNNNNNNNNNINTNINNNNHNNISERVVELLLYNKIFLVVFVSISLLFTYFLIINLYLFFDSNINLKKLTPTVSSKIILLESSTPLQFTKRFWWLFTDYLVWYVFISSIIPQQQLGLILNIFVSFWEKTIDLNNYNNNSDIVHVHVVEDFPTVSPLPVLDVLLNSELSQLADENDESPHRKENDSSHTKENDASRIFFDEYQGKKTVVLKNAIYIKNNNDVDLNLPVGENFSENKTLTIGPFSDRMLFTRE